MHYNLVDKLYCSKCQKSIKPIKIILHTELEIINGIFACACGEYPILNGILLLKEDKITEKVLVFIKSKTLLLKRNIEIPLFVFHLRTGYLLANTIISILILFPFWKIISFNKFLRILTWTGVISKQWKDYLLNKNKHTSFYSVLISSTCLIKSGDGVLDIGCGNSYFFSLLKNRINIPNSCGVDGDLLNLYYAKKYFSRDGNFIRLDLDNPLPFKNHSFAHIVSCDTFHCIEKKELLLSECKRILSSGFIIFCHVHNKKYFINDPYDKFTLYIDEYIDIFSRKNISIFSEADSQRGLLKFVNTETTRQLSKLITFTLVYRNIPIVKNDLRANIKLKKLSEYYNVICSN